MFWAERPAGSKAWRHERVSMFGARRMRTSGQGYSPEDVGRQVEPAPWFPEDQALLTHHPGVSDPPSLLTLPRTKRLQDMPEWKLPSEQYTHTCDTQIHSKTCSETHTGGRKLGSRPENARSCSEFAKHKTSAVIAPVPQKCPSLPTHTPHLSRATQRLLCRLVLSAHPARTPPAPSPLPGQLHQIRIVLT